MLQIIFWHISAAGRKTFLIQSGTVARSRHISTAGEMAEKPFLSTPALLPGPGTSPLQKRRQRNLSYPSQHCCQVPTHLHCRRVGRETFLIHPSTVARSRHISAAEEKADKPFLSSPALLPGPGKVSRPVCVKYSTNNKLFCSFITVNYMGFWKDWKIHIRQPISRGLKIFTASFELFADIFFGHLATVRLQSWTEAYVSGFWCSRKHDCN